MDEAARKSLAKKCAKPPGKKASKAGLVCENPAVALEKSRKLEQERLEKEAQAKAYAEMKHTEWRAVAVKGEILFENVIIVSCKINFDDGDKLTSLYICMIYRSNIAKDMVFLRTYILMCTYIHLWKCVV